jgi:hypothetical protein
MTNASSTLTASAETDKERYDRLMTALGETGDLDVDVETLCQYLDEFTHFLRTATSEPCEMVYYPTAKQLNAFNNALESIIGGYPPQATDEEIKSLLLYPPA